MHTVPGAIASLRNVPPAWEPLQDPDVERVWRAVLQPAAADLLAQAHDVAARLVADMQGSLPDVLPDVQTAAENILSTEQTLEALARIIEAGADPSQVELPSATIAFAMAGVHRQVRSAALVRSYRIGHEWLWQWMFRRVVGRCPDTADLATAAALLSRWTFAYIDAASTQAEAALEVERERWMRSDLADRAAAISGIVRGEEVNAQRASTRLRYELGRHHIGVLAATGVGVDSDDPQRILSRALAALGAAVGAEGTLIHCTGVTTCQAWISRARAFTAEELTTLAATLIPHARIAVGEPGGGLPGFRRSHLEAIQAQRVAALTGRVGIVRYREISVAALASSDPEHARAFVERVLGPLAQDEESVRLAAEALAVYLDENRSRNRAAARLHVHPNTVAYRVQQAEQILGHSVDAAPLDLRVALAVLPILTGLGTVRG